MTAAILADEKRSGAGRKDSRKYGVPEPLIPAREKSFPEYRRRLRHCPEAAKDNNAQARFPYRPDRHWPRQTWYRARKTRQAAKAAGPAPREDVFPAFCTSRQNLTSKKTCCPCRGPENPGQSHQTSSCDCPAGESGCPGLHWP